MRGKWTSASIAHCLLGVRPPSLHPLGGSSVRCRTPRAGRRWQIPRGRKHLLGFRITIWCGESCAETRAPRKNHELDRAWGLGSVGVRRAWGARLAKERRSGALAELKLLTRGHNSGILRVMHKDETWQFYRGEDS